jgi:hypothetical protein
VTFRARLRGLPRRGVTSACVASDALVGDPDLGCNPAKLDVAPPVIAESTIMASQVAFPRGRRPGWASCATQRARRFLPQPWPRGARQNGGSRRRGHRPFPSGTSVAVQFRRSPPLFASVAAIGLRKSPLPAVEIGGSVRVPYAATALVERLASGASSWR